MQFWVHRNIFSFWQTAATLTNAIWSPLTRVKWKVWVGPLAAIYFGDRDKILPGKVNLSKIHIKELEKCFSANGEGFEKDQSNLNWIVFNKLLDTLVLSLQSNYLLQKQNLRLYLYNCQVDTCPITINRCHNKHKLYSQTHIYFLGKVLWILYIEWAN